MDGNNSVFSIGSENNLMTQQVEHLKTIFETTTITQISSNEVNTLISSISTNENMYFNVIPLWLSGYVIVYIRRKI